MLRPLAGIRVMAIEQFGAGPYGSMYLAELGAKLSKSKTELQVETPPVNLDQ